MAETLIQERYQFDFDPGGAIAELEKLAKRLETLRGNLDAAKASGKGFEKQEQEISQASAKFLGILNQEVSTYDGINAKRKILSATLANMTKGTAAYSERLKEVRALQERELNTTTGLNARRKDLREVLAGLEKGTKEYIKTLRELNVLENRAAQNAAADAEKRKASAGSFASALRGGLASIGVVVGIQEALRLGKESLDAAAEKQQQKSALLNALNNQEAVQERLLAQADKLEATTLVDDDDIIKLDRYLASLGLTEKQISKLNDASVQLAAVQGTSVRSAADKLIAAQAGQVRGLAKLVPEVKNLTKAQLASGAAADLVAKKFAGSAEALQTGIIGARNQLKDFTDGFKEGFGDAITEGLAKDFAVFTKLSSEGAETFFGRLAIAAKKTVTDIVSIPATAVAGVKAVIAGVSAAFDFIGNRMEILLLDVQEKYIALKQVLLIADQNDLDKLEKISNKKVEAQIRNAGGFSTNVSLAARAAYDEALAGTDNFFKALKKDNEDADKAPFLPNLPKKVKIVKDSLQDLEDQVSKLKETVTKSVVATDAATLTPLLKQIDALEKRIAAAKKLQDELVNGPKKIEDTQDIPLRYVTADFLKTETQKAKIEQEFIRQNSAERLKALLEDEQAQLKSAGSNARLRENIEADFQRRREALALETERRIATNALRQRTLELNAVLTGKDANTPTGQEAAAKLKADIADLQAQLATLQGKSANLEVGIAPSAKGKIKADIKEIADAAVDLAQQIIGAISSVFDAQQKRADKAVDFQKSKLDEALANSEDFTAQQIKLERDRLDKLQKQQEQAAQRAKAAQIAQVIANTVIAVAKAAGQTGVAAPIAIITTLAAIAAGIGSAVALSQNAFDEGTDYVPLGNNRPGKDTVQARLTAGEAVLDKEDNRNYHPVVKAIRRHQIPAEVLNEFVESYRGGSQWMPKARRSNLPEYAAQAASGGGGSQSSTNYYFQAKLGRLEQESERQTKVLQSIAENTRPRRQRTRLSTPANRPDRFV